MEPASTVPTKKRSIASRARYYVSYLRSLLFTDMLIYVYTVVCGTASLAGSLFDPRGRWQHACARRWSWLILKTSRIRVKVEGLEHVDPNRTTIYCANHPSAMDIPILLLTLPVQFRFLAKRPLFHIPFLGWHLRRSGHIPVDRERPREALESLDQAAKKIQGRSSDPKFGGCGSSSNVDLDFKFVFSRYGNRSRNREHRGLCQRFRNRMQ